MQPMVCSERGGQWLSLSSAAGPAQQPALRERSIHWCFSAWNVVLAIQLLLRVTRKQQGKVSGAVYKLSWGDSSAAPLGMALPMTPLLQVFQKS